MNPLQAPILDPIPDPTMADRLDDTDRRILKEIQRDGRVSLTELSERIGLSIAPCQRRLRRLEEDGFVTGYRALLDRNRLGCGMTVFVGVKVERHRDAEATAFITAVSAMPEVVACHLVSGDVDFLIEVAVADISSYERTIIRRLLALPSVRDIRSSFALKTYKRDGEIPTGA
ncbi:MAG: Lrp/AsnC family transcriptional regulator [Hyphomicrobiaceae bacterium]